MKDLLTIEEYLDNNRSKYYRFLEEPEKDVTDYVEFMLDAIAQTAEKAKELVLTKKEVEAEDYLLPRRAEILQIIKDHQLVNFDIVRRRFMRVNERTLRYDLKKLQESGFIRKRGTTNGVYYEKT